MSTVDEVALLEAFNAYPKTEALTVLLQCCASTRWAHKLEQRRPYSCLDELYKASSQVWLTSDLSESDFLEAFAAHPPIGDLASLRQKFNVSSLPPSPQLQTHNNPPSSSPSLSSTLLSQPSSDNPSSSSCHANWCATEQQSAMTASDEVLQELSRLNKAYMSRHGFIFIVCATGKTAAEMLQLLRERVCNERLVEVRNACREQDKITKLRFDKIGCFGLFMLSVGL
eukprot:GHVQ01006699.1.p1 GENE.GHVQ01006699.1~~GHVQ01006699.1.p1  ORF type:complete len:227 (+),score=47.64 GHVQ01006699.1:340-1020(+)